MTRGAGAVLETDPVFQMPDKVARLVRNDDGSIGVIDQYGNYRSFPAVIATCQSWLLTTGIDTDESLFSQADWMALVVFIIIVAVFSALGIIWQKRQFEKKYLKTNGS